MNEKMTTEKINNRHEKGDRDKKIRKDCKCLQIGLLTRVATDGEAMMEGNEWENDDKED